MANAFCFAVALVAIFTSSVAAQNAADQAEAAMGQAAQDTSAAINEQSQSQPTNPDKKPNFESYFTGLSFDRIKASLETRAVESALLVDVTHRFIVECKFLERIYDDGGKSAVEESLHCGKPISIPDLARGGIVAKRGHEFTGKPEVGYRILGYWRYDPYFTTVVFCSLKQCYDEEISF